MNGDEPGQVYLRGGSLLACLEPELARRGAVLDHSQAAALERLQQLADEFALFRSARESTLKRLFTTIDVPRGIYLHGGVGRGKSFLMDTFYAAVRLRRKTRTHFHPFMREVHEQMKMVVHEADPLAVVAARIAARWRLICFDEFHVSDIADAMILGRLLTALFAAGVVFVMTSNYPPEALYPNGLKRENFLPTIALLEQHLDVVEVDGGVDYRLRTLAQTSAYFVPAGREADLAMTKAFDAMRTGPDEAHILEIDGRELTARRCAGSAVWFDFEQLCDGPRSQRDYLEIARRFSVIFLSGIPIMDSAARDRARRFTWLIDILYDHHVKLIASAAAVAPELYVAGTNAQEFARTVSRLIEMRTLEYMGRPHAIDRR